MKSKLFAALAALAIISGSTVSARAQDNNEAADKQPQVDSEAQDQSQYSNQPQDDSNAQYDNQAEYNGPAQNNMRVQPDAEASQNPQAENNQDTGASAASVARISLLHGDVSTQRGDSGDWSTAALNQPVVAGDRVSTSEASRAEVQLDFANILRIDERTQANVTALSRTQIQIQLARGLANYSVVKDSEADVEIDAPNLSVHPRRGDGNYRITVFSEDRAEVMVRRGEADISTPQGSTHLRGGQMITVTGTGNDTQSQVTQPPARDDDVRDRWTSDRDNTIRNAQSWSRTNQYYVGSEDLDRNGRWTNVPDYGDVWQPAVGSDWAPYRDGRWVWEPYWGWTWVSDEPWGWAPYHYGRWFMYESSWVWWPGYSYGYRHYRPVWAPAYVSFFGFGGGGFGVGFGWGSVGWLPIGPCDGFYPWWGGYRSRFNAVNIYNVHNVYNYRNGGIPPLRGGNRYSNLRMATENDRMRRAVSTVSAHDFGRGRISATSVSQEAFRNGRMVAGNLPVVPTRESLLAGERRASPARIGRGGTSERFFSPKQTMPARRQSFDREAAEVHNAIQRNGRFTPIVGNQRSSAGETNPRAIPQGRAATENQAWRRTGTPAQQSNTRAMGTGTSNPGARPERGGGNVDWRRAPSSTGPQGSAGNGSLNNRNPSGRVNNPMDRPATNPVPRGNGNQDWRRMDRPSTAIERGVNNPVDRRTSSADPRGNGNQDWRRSDRPSGSVNRGTSGPREAPASRDRVQREPSQDRGSDWRRMPPAQQGRTPVDRPSFGGSSPSAQRDSGNWRQAPPRNSGREGSRPQLDMRQPIVTPRRASPAEPPRNYRGSGGGYSSPRSEPYGGGYSGPRSAPNGGYSAPRSAPSGGYGGGYGGPRSAPSGGGGGYSAPRSAPSGGGGGRPSGGGGGGHPSGGGGHSGGGHSDSGHR